MYTYIYNASALKRITANHLGYKVYQPLKFHFFYHLGAMITKGPLRHVTSRDPSIYLGTRIIGPPSVLRTFHGGILIYGSRLSGVPPPSLKKCSCMTKFFAGTRLYVYVYQGVPPMK